ncbi:MAG: sigma 54-interacting transcriptional regulator [Clostridiales bacterium]|nr:sigma 54-interacting transcriptional regulator [Clostridiales bacterium]
MKGTGQMKINGMWTAFTETDSLNKALKEMQGENISYAPVFTNTDDEIVKGLINIVDVLAALIYRNDSYKELYVSDVMDKNFTVITEKINLDEVIIEELEDKSFPMIIINNEGKFRGLLTENELVHIQHKNLRYMKTILDNIDEGIIAVDENNVIAYINESWKQIHSIGGEELIGTSVKEKFPESKIGDVNKKNNGNIQGIPVHLNLTGATVVPSYKPILDNDHNNLGAMAIVKDYSKINDLYIGINQINKLNLLFSSIFDNLKEAVFLVDKKLRITYANKEFISKYHVGNGDDLPDNEIKRLVRDKYKLTKVNSFSNELELQYNGQKENTNFTGIPIYDAGQNLEGMIVILQDVTFINNLNYEIDKKSRLLDYYKKQVSKIPSEMICESEEFKEVISTALKVASTSVSVLIEGENGVGKELVAHLIHNNSERKDKPFVPVNCGAIPESLWESEMFGYEEGAFTGAKRGGKAGIFEIADEGTVFLDEIGELSLATQVKMLRFLQNMEIAKVGRNGSKKIDVRIIAATNKNLEKLVKNSEFREDLYYRLNVVKLDVPPLRSRVDEIKPLTERFMEIFNDRYDKNVSISQGAIRLLEHNSWPGNIRQLRNTVEQSVIMCDKVIQPYDLVLEGNGSVGDVAEDSKTNNSGVFDSKDKWNIPIRVQAMEKLLIQEALEANGYNKTMTIQTLNISRKTFYKKIKDYGLMI